MTVYEIDLERVAADARAAIAGMRAAEPELTLAVWASRCRADPGRTAQVLMTLAAWVGPDVDDTELERRTMATARAACDRVVIDRLMAGETVPATVWEKREAARRMTAAGVSAWEVAQALDVSERTAVRWRAADAARPARAAS